MSVTRFGRAGPRSRQAKGYFCVVCLSLPPRPSSISRLASASRQREANGGGSIDPAPSPSHNHVDCRISSSTYHRPEFPGARLAALCSARGMGTNIVLFSEKLGERTGVRKRAAPRFLVWRFIRCRVIGNHTKHKRWRLLLARIALSTVEYGIPCAMHAICCVVPKLKGLWFVARARMFRLASHAHSSAAFFSPPPATRRPNQPGGRSSLEAHSTASCAASKTHAKI